MKNVRLPIGTETPEKDYLSGVRVLKRTISQAGFFEIRRLRAD
jgi:hypothetical protein